MQTFQSKAPVQGLIWQPGVRLPNAGQVEFGPTPTPTGTFPAHSLIIIQGQYRVVMAGDLVLYEHEFGHATGLIDALTVTMHYQQPKPCHGCKN